MHVSVFVPRHPPPHRWQEKILTLGPHNVWKNTLWRLPHIWIYIKKKKLIIQKFMYIHFFTPCGRVEWLSLVVKCNGIGAIIIIFLKIVLLLKLKCCMTEGKCRQEYEFECYTAQSTKYIYIYFLNVMQPQYQQQMAIY